MRIVLLLIFSTAAFNAFAQKLPGQFVCTEAKYATFLPEKNTYVQKVDMKNLSVTISINKTWVTIKNFAAAVFTITHRTGQKVAGGYVNGFLLEDKKGLPCTLTVKTRLANGHTQISATMLSEKNSAGFYSQSVEYLSY